MTLSLSVTTINPSLPRSQINLNHPFTIWNSILATSLNQRPIQHLSHPWKASRRESQRRNPSRVGLKTRSDPMLWTKEPTSSLCTLTRISLKAAIPAKRRKAQTARVIERDLFWINWQTYSTSLGSLTFSWTTMSNPYLSVLYLIKMLSMSEKVMD